MLERQYVVASFLHKLWSMLEDTANVSIISWSEDGNSFIVHDQSRFSMEVLPKFYKHNNMASFIRQLNMYGFSKISHDPSHNALYSVKHAESTSVEFHHPQFIRGQPDLVASIKRKATTGSHMVPATVAQQQPYTPSPNLHNDPMAIRVLSEVQQLHKKHDSFNNQIEQLRHENEVLWREMASLRQKCHNQQTIISKVVNFLVSVIGGNGSSGMGAVGPATKRSFPMLEADRSKLATSETESSPAKVSKRYEFPKQTSGNGGVTIQEIVEDDASRTGDISMSSRPGDLVSDTLETSLTDDELSSSQFPDEPADLGLEPPVKVIQLPSSSSQIPATETKAPSPSTSSPSSTSNQPIPPGLFLNSDDLNSHLDNMQIDLDQLRSNLKTYFANNNNNNVQSGNAFNEDFLSDLFSADQPLLELNSPLPSPTLATPIASPDVCAEEAQTKPATQLVKYLTPNYFLVSGSADPLLYSQPSTSNSSLNDSASISKSNIDPQP